MAGSEADRQTMNMQDRLDLITALGEEFCTVLDPLVGSEICPQDGYEVFARVLGKDFGPDELRLLTDSQVDQLAAFAGIWLACASLNDDHLRAVVGRTLSRR